MESNQGSGNKIFEEKREVTLVVRGAQNDDARNEVIYNYYGEESVLANPRQTMRRAAPELSQANIQNASRFIYGPQRVLGDYNRIETPVNHNLIGYPTSSNFQEPFSSQQTLHGGNAHGSANFGRSGGLLNHQLGFCPQESLNFNHQQAFSSQQALHGPNHNIGGQFPEYNPIEAIVSKNHNYMGYGGLMRNLQHGANNIHVPANNPQFQVSYIRNAGFINNQQGSQQTPNFIYQQALSPQHVLHGGNHNIPHGNVNFPQYNQIDTSGSRNENYIGHGAFIGDPQHGANINFQHPVNNTQNESATFSEHFNGQRVYFKQPQLSFTPQYTVPFHSEQAYPSEQALHGNFNVRQTCGNDKSQAILPNFADCNRAIGGNANAANAPVTDENKLIGEGDINKKENFEDSVTKNERLKLAHRIRQLYKKETEKVFLENISLFNGIDWIKVTYTSVDGLKTYTAEMKCPICFISVSPHNREKEPGRSPKWENHSIKRHIERKHPRNGDRIEPIFEKEATEQSDQRESSENTTDPQDRERQDTNDQQSRDQETKATDNKIVSEESNKIINEESSSKNVESPSSDYSISSYYSSCDSDSLSSTDGDANRKRKPKKDINKGGKRSVVATRKTKKREKSPEAGKGGRGGRASKGDRGGRGSKAGRGSKGGRGSKRSRGLKGGRGGESGKITSKSKYDHGELGSTGNMGFEAVATKANETNLRNLMKRSVKEILITFSDHEHKLRHIYEENIKHLKRHYKPPDLPDMLALDIVNEKQLGAMANYAEQKLAKAEDHNSTDVIFDVILPEWALAMFCKHFNLKRSEAVGAILKNNQGLL